MNLCCKQILITIFFLLMEVATFAQNKTNYGVLLNPGEKVLYSFTLPASHKLVMICTQKNDKYLVYRFGTTNKTELQYPTVLNAASWKLFHYDGYSRGGAGNSPEELHSLSFKNNNVSYQITDNWDGYDNRHDAGIIIIANEKKTRITGVPSTIKGTLASLADDEKLIHNYYWEDNK